jgi:hypothetical protein
MKVVCQIKNGQSRENRRGDQEWAIQTQDEDQQNKRQYIENKKDEHTDHTKHRGVNPDACEE